MLRETVISSNLASVGYDVTAQILEVQFLPDRQGCSAIWHYWPVTDGEYGELINAPSPGKALFALRQEPRIQERRVATIMGDGTEVAA